MPNDSRTVRVITVFVSSPSDVQQERDVLDEIVTSINRTDGQPGGFRLELFKWEDSVTPRIGPKPQEVVDEQTPAYDVYLGIMSTRFGTPTARYGSGTAQEFEEAWKSWENVGSPWITFYFQDEPKLSGNAAAAAQYVKVCEFREQLCTQGLVATYKNVRGSREAFFEKVSEHLRNIVRNLVAQQRQRHDEQPIETRQAPSPVVGSSTLPSIQYYLARLAEETSRLTLLGMGRSLQVELPIDEAYVPLQTTMTRSLEQHATSRYKEGHAEYEENVDLGDVFRNAARLELRGVVLLGEPGWARRRAKQLAWRLAGGQSRPEDLGLPAGVTPVFLRFRNLRKHMLELPSGLRVFLDQETHCSDAPDELQSPGTDLWNGRGGGLLWILDGLDEVVDPERGRRSPAGSAMRCTTGRSDRFLVTCRFQGYFREGVPLGPKFVEFHVRPLDDGQIDRFVRDWFGAAYARLLGPGPRAESRAQADSD